MVEFWFGDNWKYYVEHIVTEKIIEEATQSMLRFLPKEEWKGKSFIDIGSGSGLFSLAALRLGCKKVVSFDLDDKSIEAATILRKRFYKGKEDAWELFQGSILDEKTVKRFKEQFDIVHSWGVLHHTGAMHKAIKNAGTFVKPKGHFILAIYNHTASSQWWHDTKKWYSSLPNIAKMSVEHSYASAVTLGFIAKRRTLNTKRERGMDIYRDAIDWIRGYPYEYASVKDIISFIEPLGFTLVATPTALPEEKQRKAGFLESVRAKNVGCNEFVFTRI